MIQTQPDNPVRMLRLIAAALCIAPVFGCGGGGGSSNSLTGPGRMIVTLNWNNAATKNVGATSRNAQIGGIPAAANTVAVRIQTPSGQQVTLQTLTRPTDGTNTSTVTVDNLPLRLLTIDVKSFAGPTTGPVLSESSYQEIINSKFVQLLIDATSAVVQLSTDVSLKSLAPAQTVTVHPVAYDPHGNVITANAASLTWTSSAPSIVAVTTATDGSATLTANAVGAATITITDTTVGTSYSFVVTVMTLTLPTGPVAVTANGAYTFAATVAGTTQSGVTWSVVETGGGTITAGGVYTAPATPGTYHIMATSQFDPTRTATVTVAVALPLPAQLSTDLSLKSLAPAQTVTVHPIAYDAHGNVIVANLTGLTWTSSAPTIVSVTAAANAGATLTATGLGTATITVTDAAAGVSYSFPMTVMTLTLPTGPISVTTGASHTFAATVSGATQTGVSWSVVEAGGGSITSAGVYTAPATVGTYHIVATSLFDASRTATVAVTVSLPPPGGVNIGIH